MEEDRHVRKNLALGRWAWAAGGLLAAALAAAALPAPAAEQKKVVVIPFEFTSKFDNGVYGGKMGELILKKLSRGGQFIIPDTMDEVRDACQSNNVKLSGDTPLAKVQEVVRKTFEANIGIWGSIERAPASDGEEYDLVIKCVDFSADSGPKVIYEVSARTKSAAEISHLYVKQMIDKLYDRPGGAPPGSDPIWEENWKKNPNLVVGGDFEKAEGGVPDGWEPRCGQQREPLGRLVRWVPETDKPENHVIRLTLDKDVAENEGLMYYSKPIPVEEGARYRFQCRWRTSAPAVKVFLKCYDEMESEYKAEKAESAEKSGPAAPSGSQSPGDRRPKALGRLREVYRSQQNLYGPPKTWNTQTQDFTPKHTKYSPKWCRVMLYAYVFAGVVEFDDVVIKQIAPASGRELQKERRHSAATDVTIKEMEENDRRSKEASKKEQ
jgi:hypothetical protein